MESEVLYFLEKSLFKTFKIVDFCKELGFRFVIITDANVFSLYANDLLEKFTEKGLKVDLLFFPSGEENKTRATKGTSGRSNA